MKRQVVGLAAIFLFIQIVILGGFYVVLQPPQTPRSGSASSQGGWGADSPAATITPFPGTATWQSSRNNTEWVVVSGLGMTLSAANGGVSCLPGQGVNAFPAPGPIVSLLLHITRLKSQRQILMLGSVFDNNMAVLETYGSSHPNAISCARYQQFFLQSTEAGRVLTQNVAGSPLRCLRLKTATCG